jgi:hypothetical protein
MSANTRIPSEMTLELRPSEAIPNQPSFHAAYQMQEPCIDGCHDEIQATYQSARQLLAEEWNLDIALLTPFARSHNLHDFRP